jgi:hypothetical protein
MLDRTGTPKACFTVTDEWSQDLSAGFRAPNSKLLGVSDSYVGRRLDSK